jgi:hypothetical protein
VRMLAHRASTWAYIGAALYVAFLVTMPFEHHDLLCELKTPQHCTACTSSQPSTDPHSPAILGDWQLSDAGRAVAFLPIADGVLLSVRSSGRSPPVQL